MRFWAVQGHAVSAGRVHLPFAMEQQRHRPWPLAPRQALLSLQGFHPAEAAGLYTEPVPPGFEASIVKLEQRLAWSAALETCREAAWKLAHLPPGGSPVCSLHCPTGPYHTHASLSHILMLMARVLFNQVQCCLSDNRARSMCMSDQQ